MGEHQIRLWQHMLTAIDAYLAGEMALAEVTGRLEGSLDASEIKDAILIHDFYEHWGDIECINAPSPDPNSVSDKKLAREAVERMRVFLLGAESRFRDYNPGRY